MIGEQRYQAAADSAARFLVKGFRKAGKYNFHRHDHPTPSLIQGIRFGDMYYILEALLWVRRYTEDAALRSAIQTSLDQYFWIGGIAGYRVNEVLWRPADDWEASKLGALLYVLNDYKEGLRGNEDPTQARRYRDASTWAASYLDWLRVPQQSASLGIGVDVYGPGGAYAYPASGFAGIGVASAADPSSIYLP
jgi:hypothetical protein